MFIKAIHDLSSDLQAINLKSTIVKQITSRRCYNRSCIFKVSVTSINPMCKRCPKKAWGWHCRKHILRDLKGNLIFRGASRNVKAIFIVSSLGFLCGPLQLYQLVQGLDFQVSTFGIQSCIHEIKARRKWCTKFIMQVLFLIRLPPFRCDSPKSRGCNGWKRLTNGFEKYFQRFSMSEFLLHGR